MDITAILIATVVVAGVGLFIEFSWGCPAKNSKWKWTKRKSAVREALPGNNCGGCGFPGCDGLATAIAKGEAPVNACPVGGDAAAKQIAKIMGEEITESVRQVAVCQMCR